MKTPINILLLIVVTALLSGCKPLNQPDKPLGFSISPDKQVLFSPGNLQYKASTREWRFAPRQYDYIGENNIKISDTYNGWIDLFGWGTGHKPTLKSNKHYDYNIFVDWGANSINGDPFHIWRTLSSDEWDYLVFNRPNARALIGVAQVNGVNGIILLPDNWIAPDSILFISGMHRDDYNNGYELHQTFSTEQWIVLEQQGAIFLPAAGKRSFPYGIHQSTLQVSYTEEYGFYWTSTATSDAALCLYFEDSYVCLTYHFCNQEEGYSVRLVKEL